MNTWHVLSHVMPGSAQWLREVQKVCLLVHKSSPQKDEEWKPVSDSTLRRIQIDCELIKKKAKVTTQARKNATTDMRTYITMFAAYQALAVTYGGVLDKQTNASIPRAEYVQFRRQYGHYIRSGRVRHG